MTLEELSVVFSADVAPFSAAAEQLSQALIHMSRQADALAGQFQAAGAEAGTSLGNALQAGILAHQQGVMEAARLLSPAEELHSQFQSAGVMAGEGLRSGLLSRQEAIVSAARSIAQGAAAALRAALQIHSPSRVTFETGRYFDEGLMQGITSSAERVEREAGALGSRTAQALAAPDVAAPFSVASFAPEGRADMDQALSALSLTIPLEVDGYRLGVAAIEGINRVNQGAGRVELIL